MKLALVIILAVGLMTIGSLAIAEDGHNVLDQIGDTLSGKGLTYAGIEAIKDFSLGSSILGIDKVGLKVWTDFQVSEREEGMDRDVRGGVRARLIF